MYTHKVKAIVIIIAYYDIIFITGRHFRNHDMTLFINPVLYLLYLRLWSSKTENITISTFRDGTTSTATGRFLFQRFLPVFKIIYQNTFPVKNNNLRTNIKTCQHFIPSAIRLYSKWEKFQTLLTSDLKKQYQFKQIVQCFN